MYPPLAKINKLRHIGTRRSQCRKLNGVYRSFTSDRWASSTLEGEQPGLSILR
jgi:hypothetical protein